MTCKTNAQADIVLLVDGSWSIGRLNFKTIRSFIARMVGVFEIGPDRVQVGRSEQMIFALKGKHIIYDVILTNVFFCCIKVLHSTAETQRQNGTCLIIQPGTLSCKLFPNCPTKEETP